MFKKPKLQMKGPSRIAMFLLTAGLAMLVMLTWVLRSQGQLISTVEVSGPFVLAWAGMIVLSWLMFLLFHKATKAGGLSSAIYIVFGVADFVLLAAALALSVWSLLPGLPAGSLFDGGEYGLQVMASSLLIVAGCLWDLLAAKRRARPMRARATVLPAAQTEAFEPPLPPMPAYVPQPSPPPARSDMDDLEEIFNQGM